MSSLWFISLFFVSSALFSGLETGGYLVNRIRLRFLRRQGDRAARQLESVLCDAHRFIFTVLIGNNIANYLLSREMTQFYQQAGFGEAGTLFGWLSWNAEAAATLTLMLPVFLFAELVPKNLFRNHADQLMYRTSGILVAFDKLFRPLTAALKALFQVLTGGRGRSEALSAFTLTLQGLREYFEADGSEGALSDHQHGMIDNLVSMHRTVLADVMLPAPQIISVSEKASVQQVLDLMQRSGMDHVAVYRGSIRNLTGMVSLFDLIRSHGKMTDPVKPLVHRIIRLPSDLALTRAFRRLRRKSETVAAVTDRSSRTVGLFRLQDIARYIVAGAGPVNPANGVARR
ncbi:MAG: CNNM domain-containing protein [Kiritimatiellales bacterium]